MVVVGWVREHVPCYDLLGCGHFVPTEQAVWQEPCPGVRDHGWRGGDGAVRIKSFKVNPQNTSINTVSTENKCGTSR